MADSECFDANTTNLHPSQMCVKDLEDVCSNSGDPTHVCGEEMFPKYQLFGIVGKGTCNRKPYMITKVFDYLDFIENIV